MLDHLPDRVSIYEVSLRDGLQNEKVTVPLGDKLRLVDALVAAGLKRIEVTSFVSRKWNPQLADADSLVRALEHPPGVTFSALVPNAMGLQRARAAGIGEIAVFISASETHNRKNVDNKTIDATIAAFEETESDRRSLPTFACAATCRRFGAVRTRGSSTRRGRSRLPRGSWTSAVTRSRSATQWGRDPAADASDPRANAR